MIKTEQDFIIKIHLIISVLIVVLTAIMYGFFPDFQFDLLPKSYDEHNFYKAIMGLYIGFSMLWIIGLYNKEFLKPALLSNIIFMFGLGFGRLISIAVDGLPSTGYVIGALAELFLGFYGLWVFLKKALNKKM